MKVRHGNMYVADLSPRMGTESGKLRPVIVIQTDLLNQTGHASTWILPCTTRLTGDSLLRVVLPEGIAGNNVVCEVMIDQSRTVDNRRFKKSLKPLPAAILAEIKNKMRLLAEL
jgi:mRNA interferase MazF